MGTIIGGGKFQRHEIAWQAWGEVAGDENETQVRVVYTV